MSKPFLTPPGVPADRLQALQKAFEATMKDPAFLAEAEHAKVEVDFNTGPETERIVKEILDLPPELAGRLAEMRK
jgi:tripartite-type tricarboxylate transporter receptor subunit TctC